MPESITERRNPDSEHIDRLPTADLLTLINRQDQTVPQAVAAALPEITRAVDAIVERFQRGGRLFYIGSGTSGRLGVLDAAECPPTFGVSPERVQGILAGGNDAVFQAVEGAEDDREAGARDLRARGCNADDAVIGISASGGTPYALGALEYAKSVDALTVSLTSNPASTFRTAADIPIVVATGPEVITGSTRMKAGTAQKLVLNMVSTAVMIRMGYVLSNLMVKVQLKNSKLVERGRRIVADVTGCSIEEACRALEEAANDVRIAILMVKHRIDRESAEQQLAEAGDNLWKSLESPI